MADLTARWPMPADLIARLEAATEGSRGLDGRVAVQLGWRHSGIEPAHPKFDEWPSYGGHWHAPGELCGFKCLGWTRDPLATTSSVDEALRLVPEGHDVTITQACGPGRTDWAATCTKRDHVGRWPVHRASGAATPALALTIALVKAMAAF